MPSTDEEPRALLFDLFGTLVSFDLSRLPRVEVDGRTQIVTIPELSSLLESLHPPPSLPEFIRRLAEVSEDIRNQTAIDHREVSSLHRFQRTLVKLGVEGDVGSAAREFTRRHMRGLAAAVYCPAPRRAMLESVAGRYRTGLISNFDHAPTAMAILHRYGLADLLEVTLISDAVGTRKPSKRIFRLASQELGLREQDCLYIGDSLLADVEGAVASGMRALWLSTEPTPGHPALAVLADAAELVTWLNYRYDAGLTAPTGARP